MQHCVSWVNIFDQNLKSAQNGMKHLDLEMCKSERKNSSGHVGPGGVSPTIAMSMTHAGSISRSVWGGGALSRRRVVWPSGASSPGVGGGRFSHDGGGDDDDTSMTPEGRSDLQLSLKRKAILTGH